MKRKWPLFACLFAAVLFFAAYSFLSDANRDAGEDEGRIQIAELRAEEIADIYYEYGGQPYQFRREADGWVYLQDPDFPVSLEPVTYMTRRLGDIVSTMRMEGGDINAEDLGFDDPTLYIKATTDTGETYEYTVGSYNDIISRYYLRAGGEELIHVVEQSFVNAFSLPLYDMIRMDVPPEFLTSDITKCEILKDGETTRFDYYKGGNPGSYSELVTWSITGGGVTDYPASTAYVTNMLAYTGTGMVPDGCVLYGAGEEDYAQFGLDQPLAVVTVSYTDASSTERTVTYSIGDKTGEQYYLMYSGSDQVFLVSTEIAETLMQTDPAAYRIDSIMQIRLDTVDRMIFTLPGGRYTVDIARKTPVDGGDEQVTYTVNGAEIPSGIMLDFYYSFFNIDAARTLPSPEETDAVPELTIEFERNTETFGRMTLEFLPYDANLRLVRFNGRSDQLIRGETVSAIITQLAELAG